MRFGANEKTPVGKSLEKRIPIQSHRRWVTAVHERAIHFYTKKPNHDFYLLPKNLECLVGDSCSGTARLGTIADRNDLTNKSCKRENPEEIG